MKSLVENINNQLAIQNSKLIDYIQANQHSSNGTSTNSADLSQYFNQKLL